MAQKETISPNLVMAGAPKSGTSSLFFWLSDHPEVCGSQKKETHFLRDDVNKHNKDLNIHENELADYAKFFSHYQGETWIAEATPRYMFDETPLKILPQLPEPPLILFILRDPVERIYSSYKFARYRRRIIDMPFSTFIDVENNGLDWAVDHMEQSKYARYLKRWVESFGKDRIGVYLFEDMKANPRAFMEGLARDLDIDPEFYREYDFQQRNKTVEIRNKQLHLWGNRLQPYLPNKIQKMLLPLYMKFNAKTLPPITEEEKRVKEELRDQYQPFNKELKDLFPELNLERWDPSLTSENS